MKQQIVIIFNICKILLPIRVICPTSLKGKPTKYQKHTKIIVVPSSIILLINKCIKY